MLNIDGSYLEGGGAIVRLASALSAITREPIRIFNIRAQRKKPGLMVQHLESLRAIAFLCSGHLANAFLGSVEIELHPGALRAADIAIEISTAGSIGLLFQTMCAPVCMAGGNVRISITGGATFGKWAPPLLTTKHVLLPVLSNTGCFAEINILRHGFYPRGGARVEITGHTCENLRPLICTEPGHWQPVQGVSIASSHLEKAKVAERQAKAAQQLLEKKGLNSKIEYQYTDTAGPGSGIILWSDSSTGAVIGADSIGERGKSSEKVGEEAAHQFVQTIQSGAAVDEHVSDQVLLFMALAKGESAITTPTLTRHAETNIHVIKQFLPVEFSIIENKNIIIKCSGLR